MKNEAAVIEAASVDTLGALLAQIADLQKQADAIKDAIKDSASAGGAKVVEGDLFKATYIESNRSTVDYIKLYTEYAKVCEFAGVSVKQLDKFQRTSAIFSVKVTSR
jgi:hypothetical protein